MDCWLVGTLRCSSTLRILPLRSLVRSGAVAIPRTGAPMLLVNSYGVVACMIEVKIPLSLLSYSVKLLEKFLLRYRQRRQEACNRGSHQQ